MDSNNEDIEKIKFYINIEPIGLKLAANFKKTDSFQSVINFVQVQLKKLGVKYELGRINEDKSGALLLAEYILGDFIENNDNITLYSEDFGFLRNNLPGDNDQNSSKKVYYLKCVSDLYKSKNFLKRKRNEKQKQKNQNQNNNGKKEDKKDEEENEEKSKKQNKNMNNKKDNKNDKKNKSEKKEEKKENKKPTETTEKKKNALNRLSSESEEEDEEENKKPSETSEKKEKKKNALNALSSESEDEEEEKNE